MQTERLPAGVWPVLLTPFRDDLSIDWPALEALVEWEIEAGVAGLFINALSAEVLHLTDGEKHAIATSVMRQVRGRLPVVSGGYAEGTIPAQIAWIKRLADTGVAGVVLSVCQIAPDGTGSDDWVTLAGRILDETADIRLGLYEMPLPYHRVVTADEMRWAASTGRFWFHKDTSCDGQAIRDKLAVTGESHLAFYNANTPTLLASIRDGGDGYSGIGANYFPELYVHLCRSARGTGGLADGLHELLTGMDAALHQKYPASAKTLLALRGLPLGPACRKPTGRINEAEIQVLRELLRTVEEAALQPGISRLAGS